MDHCESLPILGSSLVTSTRKKKKKEREKRRETEFRERKSLERESTKRGVSPSKNYPKPLLKPPKTPISAYSNAQGA